MDLVHIWTNTDGRGEYCVEVIVLPNICLRDAGQTVSSGLIGTSADYTSESTIYFYQWLLFLHGTKSTQVRGRFSQFTELSLTFWAPNVQLFFPGNFQTAELSLSKMNEFRFQLAVIGQGKLD